MSVTPHSRQPRNRFMFSQLKVTVFKAIRIGVRVRVCAVVVLVRIPSDFRARQERHERGNWFFPFMVVSCISSETGSFHMNEFFGGQKCFLYCLEPYPYFFFS